MLDALARLSHAHYCRHARLGWARLGGLVWQRVSKEASARAEYLSDPVSYDDTVAIEFSATGFLNRSVRVVAFNLGDEDPTTEDVWADRIVHGDAAKDCYSLGFRRVIVSGSNASREIVITPFTVSQKPSAKDCLLWAVQRSARPF